jgi:4,5:9,10-diseco-3-hydroxy-5,9,17-trioxoandrosta-1(10),2-diene-4-oate hydrolase
VASRRGRTLLRAGALVAAAVAVTLGGLALHDSAAPRPADWLGAAGLQARFENVNGRRLRYVRAGRGPAVVLVHGFGSSIYTWKDVIPALAADHDVVALDLPGFGLSDQPADLLAEDLPASVIGLMDALRVRRSALVGNSLGGATVAMAAAAHGERVSALVLVDAAGFNMDPAKQPALVRLAMSPLGPLMERLPGKRLLIELALRDVMHDARLVDDERVAEYLQWAQRPGGLAAVRSLGVSLEGRRGAVQEALARVAAPTLVVWGRDDTWIPIADSERFAAAITGARIEVVEDCGHMPQEERPRELLAILRRFLKTAGVDAAVERRSLSAP